MDRYVWCQLVRGKHGIVIELAWYSGENQLGNKKMGVLQILFIYLSLSNITFVQNLQQKYKRKL